MSDKKQFKVSLPGTSLWRGGVSWRNKLIALIVVAFVGLGVLAFSAFIGLESLTQGFSEQQKAEDYRRQSLLFANKLLSLERASNNLTLGQTDQFAADLQALVDQSSLLESAALNLNQPELSTMASGLSVKMASYQTMKSEWLSLSKQVGFSNAEGAWGEIEKKSKKLDSIVKLAMIAKPIELVVNNQKNWLNTRQMVFSEKVEVSLAELEGIVTERKWEKIVIGKAIAAYRSAFDPLKQLMGSIIEVKKNNEIIQKEVEAIILEQSTLLDEVVVAEAVKKADESHMMAITTVIVVACIVGLIFLFSLAAISMQLNVQLGRMGRLFSRVADGDLSEKLALTKNENDEFNQLAAASNGMIEDIGHVVSKVVNSSQSLLGVKDDLSSASEKLAKGSLLIEAETEHATAATLQISGSVGDVARRSSVASDSIRSVSSSAESGVKATGESVESMKHIADLIETTNSEVQEFSNSSTQMEGIIDVINSLADQTNLLALNAAIESARAGEAGRGFAVVADEVRALAQKTVSATGNIGEIISEFNGRADRMSKLMDQGISLAKSGAAKADNVSSIFNQINDSIDQVSSDVDHVVVSMDEISSATDGIATQMDQIFQHTVESKTIRESLVEHISELDSQAEHLAKASSRFHLAPK